MKRILVIGITTMLILALALAAYGNNTTEVTFTIEDTYELVIPSTATINSDGKGTMSIYLTTNRVDGVSIRLEYNNNYDYGKWQLLGTKGYKIPYVISSSSSTNIQPEDSIYVSRNSTYELNLEVDSTALKNALADTYKDTLVFSIK